MKDPRIPLSISLALFGTIGIFVNFISLPSGFIACSRGMIGVLFLLLYMRITHKSLRLSVIRQNLPLLLISGALIGVNWILLFESYKYNAGSITTTTLCYNMTPVFVMLASPLVLRERLTGKRVICILVSLLGVAAVAGILDEGFGDLSELRGVLFGLGAAFLYAGAVLLNKKLRDISAYETTVVQLGAAALVVLPYTLLCESLLTVRFDAVSLFHLLAVGIIHTGLAYTLYFGSIGRLPAQTVAVFSYIDPVVAIVLAALLLHQPLSALDILGAALILGSTLISELDVRALLSRTRGEHAAKEE